MKPFQPLHLVRTQPWLILATRKVRAAGWILALVLCPVTALKVTGQSWLWSGHADLGVNYKNGAWDLHVHHGSLGEFEPDDVILGVDVVAASNSVPAGPAWSFLGPAGSPVWILPQTDRPGLLFLGVGAEELAPGLFVADQVTLSLMGVQGPGHFALYTTDAFGSPTVFMNSADGITATDAIVLSAGQHRHVNWAFTAPGTYEITFAASGTLVDGHRFTSSDPATFRFAVVPEPGVLALGFWGASAWWWLRRRGRARP